MRCGPGSHKLGIAAIGAAVDQRGDHAETTHYIGLDVHKASISVAIAEDGRNGEVRFLGAIPNTPLDVAKLARRLAKDGRQLEFCYEAGGCGYGIYRQLTELGHRCTVVAPSLIPSGRVTGSRPTGGMPRSWRSCTVLAN